MKIVPTLEGGLSILPESEIDWAVLERVAVDIGRPAHLAESLSGLMDEESEWEQWVVPDLKDGFERQRLYVEKVVRQQREKADGNVTIRLADAECWYGAFNQARIALQARYRLDELDELDLSEGLGGLDPELVEAYFRDRFYASLQSLLLEFVIDGGRE